MAALTQDRNTPEIAGAIIQIPVAAGVRIFAGALVCVDADGHAVPGGATTALRAIGRAEEQVDNRLGAAGAATVTIRRGIFKYANDAALPVPPGRLGALCYVQDDQTVRAYDTGEEATNVPAGRVVWIAADGVWVDTRDTGVE